MPRAGPPHISPVAFLLAAKGPVETVGKGPHLTCPPEDQNSSLWGCGGGSSSLLAPGDWRPPRWPSVGEQPGRGLIGQGEEQLPRLVGSESQAFSLQSPVFSCCLSAFHCRDTRVDLGVVNLKGSSPPGLPRGRETGGGELHHCPLVAPNKKFLATKDRLFGNKFR